MNITLGLGPLVSLIAGILILIIPRLLNYIVALYLIVIGVDWTLRRRQISFLITKQPVATADHSPAHQPQPTDAGDIS